MDRTYTRWLAAAAAALLAAGCAQSNGDLSYVQPNYLKKSDLLGGVWYFRNTVTDTPPTTGFTFAGETGELEKIVWDIQENHLIGYRSYPQIPGQDSRITDASRPSGTTVRYCKDGACEGGHPYFGSPVVAFPIEKHFDIQRGYSPSTGEQTNVISENATDRPWNEREYIRVNWTAETMNVRMGAWGMVGPGSASDVSSWIYANQAGTDPYDWPRQEYETVEGQEKLKYFEFTARYLARPDTVDYPGYGTLPFCWLSERYDCTAQEIFVRSSIAKIDPNQTLDYEPLVYDNAMMTKFGYFRTERLNYDRRFGYNESDILYLANRHRIWKASYRRDANGNVDWSKPIPLAQREPKPIVFYLPPANRMGGAEEYRQYFEATAALEAGWDKAFRRAVAAAQSKGDAWQSVRKMLYVCENPVPRGAPAECGAEGFEARFGDLRYNFLWTVAEAVPNGLLGYGPSSADPETGEIISANANTYSAAVALQAQHTLEVVDVLDVDSGFSIEDIIRGEDVRKYMLSHPAYAGALQRSGRLQSELQGSSVQRTDAVAQGAFLKPTPKQIAAMTRISASGGLPVASGDRMRAAADMLAQHPQLESALLDNPDLQQVAMGLVPTDVALGADVRPDDAREALRQVLLRPQEMLQLHEARIEYASRRNIYLVDFYEDRQMVGLALREANWRTLRIVELMKAGRSAVDARSIADDELRWKFRRQIWRATSEHEVGHTFGLRHNFQGSFDAVNYFDPYWDLRKPTLTVDQTVNGQTRAVVPITPGDLQAASDGNLDQLYGGLHDHEYSSIMDYGGKANADWQGVGKYDEAAIIFAYSGSTTPGYVEVFDAPLRTDVKQFDSSDGQKIAITGAGYDLPVINAARINTAVPSYTERFHYSTVPLHLGSGQTIQEVVDDGVLTLRRRRLVKWSEVAAKTQQLRALLSVKPVPTPAEVSAIGAPAEVPYMFCTEDHVGYVLSCQRWDRGPDYFEINRTRLENYWNAYFFNHFQRDRYSFDAGAAYYGALGTFRDVSLAYKHWVHALYGAQGTNAQAIPNYATGPFGYDPLMQATWSMAALDSVNNLLRVMSIPEPGLYMLYTPNGVPQWELINSGVDFDQLTTAGQQLYEQYYTQVYGAQQFTTLRRGWARSMYSSYDYRSGFLFQYRLRELGHTLDQMGSIISTGAALAQFLGTDFTADQNRYYIPFNLVFRDEMYRVFGALWAVDEAEVRPKLHLEQVVDPQSGEMTWVPELSFPVQVKGSDYIAGFDYPKEPSLAGKQYVGPANITTTWTARIYALYYGMAGFSINYDLDFAKQNQIIRLGGADDVTVPSGWKVVEVTDLTTGTRYAALQPIAATEDTPAVRMVKLAQTYAEVVLDPATSEANRAIYTELFRDRIRDLDLMRGFYSVFGTAF
jgi:hypothetical protein